MRPPRRPPAAAALLLALALALGACSGGSGDAGAGDGGAPATSAVRSVPEVAEAKPAAYEAHGSVGQVWVDGAERGQPLDLVAADGTVVASTRGDRQGAAVFRGVAPGEGYRVVSGEGHDTVTARAVAVGAAGDPPPRSFYTDQELEPGYGYLETRDGTLLSVMVRLPGPPEDGPYPTVVEYSGYSPADPDSPQPSTLIASTLGYATVGVNMRGTGCSGGAFQFFETLQSTDGYDAIEVIAAQDWVAHGKVGMVGLSYPGISQLFVAATRPPHLAAIAPLSVIADTARGTLAPGGIFNDGFAKSWADERERDARPGGQAWAAKRIDEGDRTCERNQALRLQSPDIDEMIGENRFWTDEVAAPLAPELFVDQITVPVFLAGAWQDEQTGGYFANMIDDFTNTREAWFTVTNGGHTDALGPEIFLRWTEFLDLFVARRVPRVPESLPLVLGGIAGSVFGTEVTLPPERFTDVTSYEEALARFEADPRVRILFDNGAGGAPGAPDPAFEAGFDAWPVPETEHARWYLDAGGRLVPDEPAAEDADEYRYDPTEAHVTTFAGPSNGVWTALPAWDWPAPAAGRALAYETDPLAEPVVMAGNGSVDLWLQSTGDDTDLEVTLTEVRPDGAETYVQNGWLRASQRALSDDATEMRPLHTHTEADAEPLPEGEWVQARVELFPFAHAFRAGSRIRIVIDAPGASRALWTFDALPAERGQVNRIARGGAHASRVVLPVVPGVEVATPLPPCPSLRAQPCRPYAPLP